MEKKAKHENDLQNLHQGRQRQFADIDSRMKEEAKIERDQFLAVVSRQKQQEEEERQLNAQRRSAFMNYKTNLNDQMGQNEVQRQNAQHDKIVEGRKSGLIIDQERNRVKMIQAQKLSNIKAIGISDKYTSALQQRKTTF